MSYFGELDLGTEFAPYRDLEAHYGHVPSVFRAQSRLPRAIEAQASLARAVFGGSGILPRIARERILLAVAAAYRDLYWVGLQWRILSRLGVREQELEHVVAGRHAATLSLREAAIVDFALKLSCRPDLVGKADIDMLRAQGLTDAEMHEAAVTTAVSRAHCILATGTGVAPNGEAAPIPVWTPEFPGLQPAVTVETNEPYLSLPTNENLPSLGFFVEQFGLVPNLISAQSGRPDLVDPQIELVKAVLVTGDVLSRMQKEALFVAVAAANLSTYCVAVHCQILRGFGVAGEDADQIAVDHHLAPLPEADKGLIDFALKLRRRPGDFGPEDVAGLLKLGFSELQVLEAVAMTSLTTLFNTLSVAMEATPDFPPQRVFRAQEVHRYPAAARPRWVDEGAPLDDPDGRLVAKVRGGDTNAFEEIVRRHTKRVYRTAIGILADPDEAQDATQEVFLKAFQHIGSFQGRSKFSTWLVSIAVNAGMQRLRERRPLESLDDPGDDDSFRPRQVRAWQDDPEQLYSKEERRGLVERAVVRLPAPYRLAVLLRDIEQLSNEEAAAALNLSLPAFKARVFRGRCILREALAPHFIRREREVA